MPSMKWIKECLNEYLDCCHQDAGKSRLASALYNQRAYIVSEVFFWLETQARLDNMVRKKNNETKRK